ncbi:hypothetical protein KR059_012264, partial [Drosophila kikkawai]
TMAWRSFILLTTLPVLLTWAQSEQAEGSFCPSMANYPSSTCMKTCPIIEDYIIKKQLKREDVVTCNKAQGLICCPNKPPQDTSLQQGSRRPPPLFESNARKYRHLAELAFNTEHFSDHTFRCTGVLVRPNFVLTSALCGESLEGHKSPTRARLGLIKHYNGPIEFRYDRPGASNYNNDLSLLKLNGSFKEKFVAHICTQREFDSANKLVAVGFSQRNGTNCHPFQMEVSLREFSSSAVEVNLPVRGIGNETHFYVRPIKPLRSEAGACNQCLRGSASILHAVLPDDGICVAGVATPTSSNCHDSGAQLYYTSLINADVAKFIRD